MERPVKKRGRPSKKDLELLKQIEELENLTLGPVIPIPANPNIVPVKVRKERVSRKSAKEVRKEIIKDVVPVIRSVLIKDNYRKLADKKLAITSTRGMFNKNYEPKFPKSKQYKAVKKAAAKASPNTNVVFTNKKYGYYSTKARNNKMMYFYNGKRISYVDYLQGMY